MQLVIVASACLIGIERAESRDSATAPPLPPPSGQVIKVSTEPQLQAAIRNLASGGTILIAPGVYKLTSTLNIGNRPLTKVALRGATNNRNDVVLAGPGMTNRDYGSAPHGVWTGNGVDGILIANLTISGFYFHPLILNAGTRSPHIYNVRLLDGGEQLLKSNPDANGKGIDNGLVEYSAFEFTTRSRGTYTNGVDVLGGADWIIRDNLFRNITAPTGLAGPSLLMWRGSKGTIAERNTFIDCQREIAFGLVEATPDDHSGGIIRNNFFYKSSSIAGDAAINVIDSPGTKVLHNTIVTSGTYPNAIEYRFPNTAGGVIANNLTDAAIRSRDGGTATLTGNLTTVAPGMFGSVATGDLHLTPAATAALDKGVAVADAVTDWDGDPRPQGAAPDVGADERRVESGPQK